MTDKGRYWVKIMNLNWGYAFLPSKVDLSLTSFWLLASLLLRSSACMPLLCFFKLYNDYLSQSQNYNSLLSSYPPGYQV